MFRYHVTRASGVCSVCDHRIRDEEVAVVHCRPIAGRPVLIELRHDEELRDGVRTNDADGIQLVVPAR